MFQINEERVGKSPRQCVFEDAVWVVNEYLAVIKTAIQRYGKHGPYSSILEALKDAFDTDPNPDFQYQFGRNFRWILTLFDNRAIPNGLATKEDEDRIRKSFTRLLSYPCEEASYVKWLSEIEDELRDIFFLTEE